MTNKLKTLKDFQYKELDTRILASDLKSEAVKWVKYGRKFKVEPKEEQWLTFFNLTEEDLEEKK